MIAISEMAGLDIVIYYQNLNNDQKDRSFDEFSIGAAVPPATLSVRWTSTLFTSPEMTAGTVEEATTPDEGSTGDAQLATGEDDVACVVALIVLSPKGRASPAELRLFVYDR